MLEFSLPTNDIPLSSIFSHLEEAKAVLQLQDYSVSQTTLDQVFVSFASQQNNDLHTLDEPSRCNSSSLSGPESDSSHHPVKVIVHNSKDETDRPAFTHHQLTEGGLTADSNTQPSSPLQEPEPDYMYHQRSLVVQSDAYTKANTMRARHSGPSTLCALSAVGGTGWHGLGSQTTRPPSKHHQPPLPSTNGYAAVNNIGMRTLTSAGTANGTAAHLPNIPHTFTPNHRLYGYPATFAAAYATGWNPQAASVPVPRPFSNYATIGQRLPKMPLSGIAAINPVHHYINCQSDFVYRTKGRTKR